MSDRCFFCDQPATKLCDFVIGYGISGYARVKGPNAWRAVTSAEAGRFTCDTPTCDACATVKGRIFFCAGKDSMTDSIDRCRLHGTADKDPEPMTPVEADAIRRRLRMRVTARQPDRREG